MCTNSADIPYLRIQPQNWWIERIIKYLFYIGIVVALYFLLKYVPAIQQNEDTHLNITKTSTSVQCFHCITNTRGNITHPDIPTDDNCESNPTNIKICSLGELCWSSYFKMDGTFIRSCMKDGKFALGCHNITKPYPNTACYCKGNLCM